MLDNQKKKIIISLFLFFLFLLISLYTKNTMDSSTSPFEQLFSKGPEQLSKYFHSLLQQNNSKENENLLRQFILFLILEKNVESVDTWLSWICCGSVIYPIFAELF